MYKRRRFLAASAGMIAFSGCSGNEATSDGTNTEATTEITTETTTETTTQTTTETPTETTTETPTETTTETTSTERRSNSREGVVLTEKIFDVGDVNGDGQDDLIFGAKLINPYQPVATVSLAYDIQFPETTVSNSGQYMAPSGESSFEQPVSLTSGELFTESEIEYIKNDGYEYDIRITDVDISNGVQRILSGSSSGQCDPSVLMDEPSDPVDYYAKANGGRKIESLDITITDDVDFSVSVSMSVFFYREAGDFEPISSTEEDVVLEGGESRDYEVTETTNAEAFNVQLVVSCP